MLKAQFEILDNTNKFILINDLATIKHTMSITNDAEEVVEYLIFVGYITPPNKRIFYIDTEGRVDELEHNGKKFIGFKPGFDDLNTFTIEMRDIEI